MHLCWLPARRVWLLMLCLLAVAGCSQPAASPQPVSATDASAAEGQPVAAGPDGEPASLLSRSAAVAPPLPIGAPDWQPAASDLAAYRQAIARLLPLLETGSPAQRLAAHWLAADDRQALDPAAALAISLPGAGQNPLLAHIALISCPQVADCPRAQLLAVTEALAAGDANLQLMRLTLSPAADQPALWEAVSQAERFGDGLQLALALLLRSTEPLPATQAVQQLRLQQVTGQAAAAAMPSLHAFAQRCPVAVEVTAHVLQCRRVAALMADSPSLLTAGLGTGLMGRLALDPAQRAYWAGRYRQLQWLTQAGNAVLAAGHQDARFVQDWSQLGDRQAYANLLQRAGLPAQPPARWQPGMPIPGY